MQHQNRSFFSNLFKKSLTCERCLQHLPSSQIESCTKCRNLHIGQKICKNCAIFQKRRILFVYISYATCLNCTITRQRSLSQSLAPIELTQSFSSEFGEGCKMIPLKEITFNKFIEEDTSSAVLPSMREVIPKKFQQDLKSLIKIQKKDPKEIFELREKVGRGGFSKVYKAVHKQSGAISALKQIKVTKADNREQILNEIGIMQLSKHPNIVQCNSCYETPNEYYIEMEFLPLSLSQLVKKVSGKMTEKNMAYIIREMLHGLAWLHRNNRVHRDIKSSNVLISDSGDVKLTDFGISCQITKDDIQAFSIVGTPCWMAPELITSKYHDSKADIWSLGIVLLELCEQNPPHIEKDKFQALDQIVNGPAPSLKNPNKWSKHLLSFFRSCVNKIPEQRPSATDLLRHIFIYRVGSEGKEHFVEFLNSIQKT